MVAGESLVSVHVENSRYNPQLMASKDLEQLFVGREKLIKEIMEGLTASITDVGKHYYLLVGPRGSGKTHFVHLIANRLRQDSNLDGKFLLAHFKEEEWEIDSYLEFLLQVLQSLGREKGGELFVTTEQKIRSSYDPKRHNATIRSVEKTLIRHTKGKTLLLICENLADLMAALGDDGQWKWRSFMQEHPFWTLLATSPVMSEDIRNKENAFYGFFHINPLGPLANAGEVSELLKLRAVRAGTPDGKALAEVLDLPMGRARSQAIHHLAGGNHRACVTLFPFLDKESLDELVGPFTKMLDELTPYYQSRIKDLSPGQRKIVSFLARMRKPTAVGEVAAQCLMSPQTAAKEISRLADYGVLLRHKLGRNTLCELSEPLMRLCFEVKANRAEHLQLFVDLLRGWFSGRELQERYEALRAELNEHVSSFDRNHLQAALEAFSEDGKQPFLNALNEEGKKCWENGDYQGAFETAKRLVDERGTEEDYVLLVSASVMLDDFKNVKKYAKKGYRLFSNNKVLQIASNACLGEDFLFKINANSEKFYFYYELTKFEILIEIESISGISTFLARYIKIKSIDPIVLGIGLANFLSLVTYKYGPSVLAEYVRIIRKELAPHIQQKVLERTLMSLLRNCLDSFQNSAQIWQDSLPSLENSVKNLKECETPLRMLRIVIRRAKDGNDNPLLDLPLEERQLLESIIERSEKIKAKVQAETQATVDTSKI